MSRDPSHICRHCSMFACGEATDPREMCREAILDRLAASEARVRALVNAAATYRNAIDAYIPIAFEGPGGTAAEAEAETVLLEAEAVLDALLAPPPEAEKKGGDRG